MTSVSHPRFFRKPVSHPCCIYSDFESYTFFRRSSLKNIDKWIPNFYDVISVLNLSDCHKFMFAKQSQKGKAQLLIQAESHINPWVKLKQLLSSEFASSYNSAELYYDMLNKIKFFF